MASDKEIDAIKGSGLRGKLNKVVLAYSGGLDTSVIVPWLRYNTLLFTFVRFIISEQKIGCYFQL